MRGVDSCAIVSDDSDFQTLHLLLGITLTRHAWRCTAYCLMTTHFHLMVETPNPDLDRGMQYLAGLYAQSFNRRHGRTGHLFGERYYSGILQKESHHLETIRYIALNPVRAGICAAPEDWRWSNYAAAIGQAPTDSLVATSDLLGLFAAHEPTARRQLREFVWPALLTGSGPG